MAAKYGRFLLADLVAHSRHDGVEILAGGQNGVIESTDFLGQQGIVEVSRFARGQHFVHTESAGHSDARGNGNAFEHGDSINGKAVAVNHYQIDWGGLIGVFHRHDDGLHPG